MPLLLIFSAILLALAIVGVAFFQLGPVLPFVVAFVFCVYALVNRLPRSRVLLPGVLFAFTFATSAHAATIDIGQAIGGSLIEILNGAITAVIAAGVGWVLMTIKTKFNIDIEAKHREALTAFLNRQASSLVAKGAVKLQGAKIEVSSDAVAIAANTALAAIPDALKFFGLTPETIQKRIVDLLPQQPAVAQAQAVAIDVANPSTPSVAPTAAGNAA